MATTSPSTTPNTTSESNCAKCAEKIKEFCRASYPDDVALSYGPTKLVFGTGGFQYTTPTNIPFIYSLENFKSNTVLCNRDEYITKIADLPECVGVNPLELSHILKPSNILIDTPRVGDFHYFPFSSIISTSISINYYPVYYTMMKSMGEHSRSKMRERAFFCAFWRVIGLH